MFVAINELRVPAEMAEMFEREFSSSMRATLSGVAGLRRATLIRPLRADQPYVAQMEFGAVEDYRAYLRSGAYRDAHPGDSPGEHAVQDSNVAEYTTVSVFEPTTT